MKKRLVIFILYILLIGSSNVIWSQPNPGESSPGAASGHTVGYVPGGGADLYSSILLLMVSALLYIFFKLRWNVFDYVQSIKKRFQRAKFSFFYTISALRS